MLTCSIGIWMAIGTMYTHQAICSQTDTSVGRSKCTGRSQGLPRPCRKIMHGQDSSGNFPASRSRTNRSSGNLAYLHRASQRSWSRSIVITARSGIGSRHHHGCPRRERQLKQMDRAVLEQIDPRVLGARLQDARKASGFTQQAVADLLRIAPTTVVAIEKGERRVTVPELLEFAKVYADRKSTRLNSSHLGISYAVFCLKKK